MIEEIEKAIDEVRPALARHLGSIEFLRYEDGVVYVRFLGMCRGCPLSQLTLKAGIEDFMKAKIPEIKRVEAEE
jgi:Fe-S cluster biogenesis protein NfuA